VSERFLHRAEAYPGHNEATGEGVPQIVPVKAFDSRLADCLLEPIARPAQRFTSAVVGSEAEYLDRDGNKHIKINDNVLIEIGAAMAFYGKKVILLVQKSVPLSGAMLNLTLTDRAGGHSRHRIPVRRNRK